MEILLKNLHGQWQLVKMRQHPKTGAWLAERHDKPGTPHPDNPNRVVHHTETGLPGFAPHPDEQERRDKELPVMYNDFMRSSNNKLSSNGKQLFTKLTQHILRDPDRHAERTSVEDTYGGIRLRHLYHLLNGNPHYSLKEHEGGLLFSATRHINNVPEKDRPVDQWHITKDGVRLIPRDRS
jgi:hypothetical protein